MKLLKYHIVPEGVTTARLSDYTIGVFPEIPLKKGIKKAIKKGWIKVNGAATTTGTWVQTGMRIELYEVIPTVLKSFPLVLKVIYEDEHFAVIYKPSGITVSGNKYRTIYNALPVNLTPSTLVDAFPVFLPVHRLDNPTSGLLIVAKTYQDRITLGRLFEQKKIQKTYYAVVIGALEGKGIINTLIDGKASTTHYESLWQVPSLKNEWLTLVKLHPETGRTHQLRIHLSEKGFPILGDALYGKEGLILKGKGLFLSAIELKFPHPATGDLMEISVEPPAKFQTLMEREERRFKKYE